MTCSPSPALPLVPTGDRRHITVTGSNHGYVSEVDALTSDANNGTASVQTIGDEAGTLFVMAKVTGDAAARCQHP